MNDIQKARDVLAKWRAATTAGRWKVQGLADYAYAPKFETIRREDAVLIVGTAGNPDLLNAIDALFDVWARAASWGAREFQVDKIAAAIIAADERMQQ